MLFNEPKLLKSKEDGGGTGKNESFSALQRAEIAEIDDRWHAVFLFDDVSVLFNEPKLLKWG